MHMVDNLDAFDKNTNCNKLINMSVFIIYVLFLCLVSYYHEPWHDEGQAWLIARDDSLWQLLTVTTHYEGHPPLWYLVLMPFAKLGIPFEAGIKSINIFFASLATWFVLFKSPLPWYLRIFIPFSYFYFYQYGVINRSYSLLLAATMATACYYPYRKQKPYALAACLAVMSATMAYGMAIAGGIAFSWLYEIIVSLHTQGKLTSTKLWSVKSIKALSFLLIIALLNVFFMFPHADAAFLQKTNTRFFNISFLYSLLVIPGQIICTNDIKDFFQEDIVNLFSQDLTNYMQSINESGLYGIMLLVSYLLSYSYGAIFTFFLGYICHLAKKLLLFLVPLLTYALLASHVFWNSYHAGILAGFFVFIIWQLYADKAALKVVVNSLQKQFTFVKGFCLVRYVYYMCVALILGINIYWSFSASLLEINKQFDASREIAAYFRAHDLEDTAIWIPPTMDLKNGQYLTIGTYAINAYFTKNIIEDLDGGNQSRSYHEYKLLPAAETINKLRTLRKPDYIIAGQKREVDLLQQILNDKDDFEPVRIILCGRIWKGNDMPTTVTIYKKVSRN